MKYFIGVVSKEHVERGKKLGIAQLGHGKIAPLKRLHKDDWLIYYSPKMALDSDEKYQCFTAIGQMVDDNIYQDTSSKDFQPFRRNVDYKKSKDVSIIPLIEKLSFIRNKTHWGYVFRYGLLEIPESDFKIILDLMLEK
jgi:predicted RNA-binding protein